QLSGRFAFEEIRNSLGQRIVRMAATGVEMSFANSMLVVHNGEGVLLILPAGVAGRLSAQVGLAANSGVSLRGSFSLEFNTTSAAISQTFRIGANTTVLDLVAGPFLRVSGDDVSLVVAGQTLSGNFAFEQITTGRGQDGIPGTPDDILALRIAATDVSLSLGDGSVSILSATSGSGTFLIIDRAGSPSPGRGIAGRLSATVALRGVPGVSLSGTLAVEINNTGEEIDQVFFVGGLPVPFKIEAGNFVRVSGTGVRVDVLGQTLTGNFAFEERTVDKTVTVTFSEVEFGLGDGTRDFVRVTKGAGTLILIKDGLYGQFTGSVAVDIPDVTFSGAFIVQLNSTSTARTISGGSVSLAANSLKIDATGVTLAIAGQQVSASRFTVEEVTTTAGRVVRITVQNFGLRLRSGTTDFVTVSAATAIVEVNRLGVAARVTGLTPTFNLPGLTLSGGTSSFELNTAPVPFDLGDGSAPLPAGPFLRVNVQGASLAITSGPTLTGNFVFDQSTRSGFGAGTALVPSDTSATTAIALADVDGDGDLDLVTGNAGTPAQTSNLYLNNGSGGFSLAAATLFPSDAGATTAIALADVNGDGFVDLVVGNNNQRNRVYLNRGRQTVGTTVTWLGFASGQDVSTDQRATTSLAVGDVNGDGLPDLIVGNNGTGNRLYLNQGLDATTHAWLGFAAGTNIGSETDPTTAVALGDVDGDRDLDLIVGNRNAVNRLYLNNGTGTFSLAATSPFAAAQATTSLAVGDVNGDGALDFVVGNAGQGNQLYLNAGTQIVAGIPTWQGFGAALPITTDTDATTSLALGDVDGDNDVDLVAGNNGTANKLYRNNGSKTDPFKDVLPVSLAETTGLVAKATTSVALANIDGDHDLDLIAGNTGQPKVVYSNDQVKVTRIALSNITVSLTPTGGTSAVSVKNGQGALVLTTAGMAGNFSGAVQATVGDFGVDASIAVRINTTASAVDETIDVGGVTQVIRFSPAEVATGGSPFIKFAGSGTIRIGNFIEIEGSFTGSPASAFGTANIFVGQGPSKLADGSRNPSAAGILLKDARYEFQKDANGKYALFADGETELLGIPGVTLSGHLTVRYNETGASVTLSHIPDGPDADTNPDTVTLLATDNAKQVSGTIGVTILNQTLSGQFAFSQNADGSFSVTLSPDAGPASDVVLNLGDGKDTTGDGTPDVFPVTVTIASGSLTLAKTGLYGFVTATPTINVTGFSLATTVSLRINTTANPVTVGTILIPANSVRVEASPATLTVLGQSLTGNFVFEQVTGQLSPQAQNNPGAQPPKFVRVAASNVAFFIGDATTPAGVRLQNGEGFFVVTPAGLAGRLGGTITFAIPGNAVGFEGTFGVAINTTVVRVSEQFEVGADTVNLVLPAGPYLRVEGTGVRLTLVGQRISGDFVFEKATSGSGDIVRVLAQHVSAALGDGGTNFVTLDGGFGFFVIRGGAGGGFAGEIGGDVSVSVPGVTLQGRLSLAVNNLTSAVTETITFGPQNNATTAVVLGDVNGDVLPDLIVGNNGGGNLLYLNDGSGNPFDALTALKIGSETDPTTALALGDLNGDGAPDLVVGNAVGTANRVYLNDGTGIFTLAPTVDVGVNTSNGTTSLALGDVDGDGKLDLVVGIDGAPNAFYRNRGRDTSGVWQGFEAASPIGSETDNTRAVALGDVDKDGYLDLVVGNYGQVNRLYRNNGTTPGARFAAAISLGTQARSTTSIALGDVNGDQFLDVVAGNDGQPNFVYLALTTGTPKIWSSFSAGQQVSADTDATTAVRLVDIDTDGDLDLIVGTRGTPAQADRLYLNNGSAVFTLDPSGRLTSATNATTALAVGDVNVDGRPDLIVGINGAPSRIHLNDGAGKLGDGAELGVVSLNLPMGPYLRFEGQNLNLVVLGQTLTGSFRFEQQSRPDGQRVVTVDVPSATLTLGEGLAPFNLSGSFLISNGGLAGKLELGTSLNLGPVSLSGTLAVLLNTQTTPATLNDASQTRLPAGPYFRIEGTGINVTVANVVLHGDFALEQTVNQVGQRRLTIAVSNGSLSVGPISVTGVTGVLVVLPSEATAAGGLAGSLSASINLGGLVAGVTFSGTFGVAVNQTARAVNERVTVGGTTLTLDLPAGPYVRVEGIGVELNVLGQTLSGNFAFEQITSTDNGTSTSRTITRISASNVTLRLGDGTTDFVTLTDGQGSFVILDIPGPSPAAKGLAGQLSGTVGLNVPGVSFTGALGLTLNNTGLAVNETFTVGGTATTLSLDAGSYARISGTGVTLTVLGQRLSGDFFFEQARKPGPDGTLGTADDQRVVRLGGKNITLFLGDDRGTQATSDDVGLLVQQTLGQDAKFLVTDAGLAGEVAATVSLRGIPTSNVTIGDLSMRLEINNTTRAVNETITGLTNPLVLPVGPYVRVEVGTPSVPISLTVFGQTLKGVFVFEQATSAGPDHQLNTTDDVKIIRVSATNVELFLGDDNQTPSNLSDDVGVRITNGSALFLITPAGFAGEITASASLRISDGNAATVNQVRVAINNLSQAVDEQFRIGGSLQTLSLPMGPFVRVELNGLTLTILGQRLSGDFAVERVALGGPVTITAANVALRIGTDQRDFVTVSNGQGFLRISGGTGGGVFGRLTAAVTVNVPNVLVSGTFDVRINTTTTDQTVSLGGQTLTLKPGVKVSGTNVTLGILGQQLTGSVTFEQDTAGNIGLAIKDASLRLGDGTRTFVTVAVSQGAVLITNQGIAASVTAGITLSADLSRDFQFSGTVTLALNTTTAPVSRTFTVGDAGSVTLNLPAGPFLRVQAGLAGNPVTLKVLGQTFKAVFAFEQATTAGGAQIVRIGFTEVELFLGDDRGDTDPSNDEGVRLTNGAGSILVTPQGIAGEFGGTIAITPALQSHLTGFTIGADLLVQINNLAIPVHETFGFVDALGAVHTKTLNLPAGPYVRASAFNASLTVATVALEGNFFFDRVTRTTGGATSTVTRIAMAGVRITNAGASIPGLSSIEGALIIFSARSGVAGTIAGQVEATGGGFTAGASVGVSFNTTGAAVHETIDVNGRVLVLDLDASPTFSFEVRDLDFNFNNLLEIRGNFHISGNAFSGSGLEVFIGQGPSLLADGTPNPDAIGVLITNAHIDFQTGFPSAGGGPSQYVLVASGTIALVGLDGLVVQGTVTFQVNTTPQPHTVGGQNISANTFSFVGTGVKFSVGGVLEITGGLAITRQPNGVLDVSISNAEIGVTVDNKKVFTIKGSAAFTMGSAGGFRLKTFSVSDFSIFDQTAGPVTSATGANGATTTPTAFPTADLAGPFNGAVVVASDFLPPAPPSQPTRPYIDVRFNDPNGVGLREASILDDAPELELSFNGAPPVTVSGVPTRLVYKLSTGQ
ncbi:MAG: hypothetical protein DMF83_24450, partial [Acidobacteria bacterium]